MAKIVYGISLTPKMVVHLAPRYSIMKKYFNDSQKARAKTKVPLLLEAWRLENKTTMRICEDWYFWGRTNSTTGF
jgi:hypothetical protein